MLYLSARACLLAYTYHIFPTPLHSSSSFHIYSPSFLSIFFPLFSSFSFSSLLFFCYLLLHLISFLLPLLHLLFTAASTRVLFLIACIACTYRRTNPNPLHTTR
ncbi:hypothetical protein FB451DRAFT_1259842, partial [Mycena latifolia]